MFRQRRQALQQGAPVLQHPQQGIEPRFSCAHAVVGQRLHRVHGENAAAGVQHDALGELGRAARLGRGGATLLALLCRPGEGDAVSR